MAETATKTRVSPDVCTYIGEDEKSLMIEVVLPGVKREGIDLKVQRDGFMLTASRDEVDYVASYTFCCPVNPDGVSAQYDNGLLKITAPYEEFMKDAKKVEVS